jgi:5-methylcytosine-specific restriction endonuclease McrA
LSALARDLYACVRCGGHGGKLDVDHILPLAGWPGLAFDLANLQTLCPACNVDKQSEEQALLRRVTMMTLPEREREAQRFVRQQQRRQAYKRMLTGGVGVL